MAQPARPAASYRSQNGAGQQPYSNGEAGRGAWEGAEELRRGEGGAGGDVTFAGSFVPPALAGAGGAKGGWAVWERVWAAWGTSESVRYAYSDK